VSRTVYLDADRLKDRVQAHEYLAEMLSLPEYYGKNLDALYDCLTELKDCRIVILYTQETELSDTYGEKIVSVLEEAARENSGLSYMIMKRE